MSSFKYIIANVKIPIELLSDGTTIALEDRVHIELEHSNDLPSIQDEYNKVIMQKLSSFIKHSYTEEGGDFGLPISAPNLNSSEPVYNRTIPFITKDELYHYKKRNSGSHNSLKNKNKKMTKQMTYKNRL